MKGKSVAIRQARRLLSQMGIDAENVDVSKTRTNAIDVEDIAKRLDINVVYQDFESDISGVFFRKNNNLFLGVNKTHHPNRQRFTVAHEIGHYILHSSELLHYDTGDLHFRKDDVSGLDEVEANHFAAELLMPASLVDKCIESGVRVISDLADRFGVSEDAMRYRLINLGWL